MVSYGKGQMIQKPEPKAWRVVRRVMKNDFQGLQTSHTPCFQSEKVAPRAQLDFRTAMDQRRFVWLRMMAALSLPRRVCWDPRMG